MKKSILFIIAAVLIGFAGGYFIFSDKTDTAAGEVHSHDEDADVDGYWTCSMHPQIRQPEPGKCPICGMELIPAEAGSGVAGVNEVRMTKNAMALANIQTTVVGKGTGTDDSSAVLSGKIKINEEANAIQASYFDGRIEKLFIDFTGQEVRKGQLLATIYSPGLVAAQQELLTAASLKGSQTSLYQAVRNKLKLWKLTEEQIQEIEDSGKVRENFPIYATVSGTVAEKLAAEGDYIKQGQPILKVSNLNTVWADFDVYEAQISRFKVGQDIAITSAAYPDKEVVSAISFIDPVLNTQTRTVTVRAALNNREGLFKPGMFIKGFVKKKPENTQAEVRIPSSAVMWTGQRSLVYVRTDPAEPVFEMREILIGDRSGDSFAVISGLEAGEEIVVNGAFTVDAAAQLQGKQSMMNNMGGQVNSGHDHGAMTMRSAGSHTVLTDKSQPGAMNLLASYMKLKDALVNSSPDKVKELSGAAMEDLSALKKQTGADAKSFLNELERNLSALANSSDLQEQRSHFVILSEQMIMIAMELKDKGQPLYVQYCPMANQDRGAQWLSWEREVRNPYYGNAMLTCGEVRKEL